jgi:hypothetical protein
MPYASAATSAYGSLRKRLRGSHEVYLASKSVLGGDDAKLTVNDSIPGVVDTIVAHAGDAACSSSTTRTKSSRRDRRGSRASPRRRTSQTKVTGVD